MDAQQRNYIVERIKSEFNTVVEPLRKKKKPTVTYPSVEEVPVILDKYFNGDKSNISSVNYNDTQRWDVPFSSAPDKGVSSITFYFNGVQPKQVDYSVVIKRMADEKNSLIDQIMLGDVPNAATLLANFVAFLKTEKEKLNVN